MGKYDDLLDEDEQRSRLRTTMYGAVGINPEQYGEASRLSRSTGVPAEVAARNLPEVRRQDSLNKYDLLLEQSPTLAKQYATNPDFARMAHDDAGPLSAVESSFRSAQFQGRAVAGKVGEAYTRPPGLGGVDAEPGFFGKLARTYLGASTLAGLQDVVGAGAKLADAFNPFTTSQEEAAILFRNDPAGLKRFNESAAGFLPRVQAAMSEASDLTMENLSPEAKEAYGSLEYATTDFGKAAYLSPVKVLGDAIRSLPTSAAMGLTIYLTRGAAAQAEADALAAGLTKVQARQAAVQAGAKVAANVGAVSEGAVGYAQQQGQTANDLAKLTPEKLAQSPRYQEFIAQGYAPEAARQRLIAETSEQAGVYAGIVDAAVNKVGGAFLGKILTEGGRLLPRIGKGFLNEGITELFQSGGEKLGENLAMRNVDPAQSLTAGVLESMVQGFVVGGLTGGSMAGVFGQAHNKELSAAQQAELHAQRAERFAAAVDQTKTKARDPVAFQQYIASLSEAGAAPTELWVDPEHLVNSLNQSAITADELRALAPETAAQLEAAVPGASIRVPLTEFAAAPTELTTGLIDHLRETPESPSRTEAREILKERGPAIREQVERELTQHLQREDRRQELEQVQQHFQQTLDAAGKDTPEVNKVYASALAHFYTTEAARAGIPIEQFMRDYRLDVTTGQAVPRGTPAAQQQGAAAPTEEERLAGTDGATVGTIHPEAAAAAPPGAGGENILQQSPAQLPAWAMEKAKGSRITAAIKLRPVLANDLFRAVHDAFGHGMEGAGFREQGEENAWQAHVRLFTGSAVGAVTSETRGQNSWLNYGPHGQTNRTAKVEDTVFAEQKTGLMPEWTWTEGRVADETPPNVMEQGPDVAPRGTLSFATDITSQPSLIRLLAGANLSTFIHESGHFFLEVQAHLASRIAQKISRGETVTPGEHGIADDMERILEWMEIQPGESGLRLDTWAGMTLAEKTFSHEKWARGIERYFMEGKAPSLELQPLFSRVRAWMINVYKTLRGLNVTLTPEVRQVMDRMLASDQAIAEAEMARGMGPMFQTPEQAGMTPEEFAAYHARGQRTTEAAAAALDARLMKDMKWMSRAKAKFIKERQAEAEDLRRQMRMEVTPEVMATNVYRAWESLTARGEPLLPGTVVDPGPTPVLRLNTAQVKEMAPDALEILKARRMTHAEKGWHPDIVAEVFGFESGQQMLNALATAPPPREVIEQLVDQRMLERHGDITSDAALQQAADEAVHNQMRARVIATELKALAKAGRVRESGTSVISRDTVDVLAKAAEEYAAQVIARQRIKDLRPNQYAAAEARSAKLAQQALGKSLPEAAMHKRNQLINNFATKAAYDAQAEIDKAREFFRRVLKGNADDVAKRRDYDIVQAMRAILADYGVGTKAVGERAQGYLTALQQNDPATFQILHDRIELLTLNAKPLNDLTVEEFRGLVDELKSMWEMSARNREVLVDGKLISLETAKMDLAAQMQAIGVPARVAGEGYAVTDWERATIKLRTFVSYLRRVESWVETMDGGPRGPFHTYVWNPIKDSADRVRAAKAVYLRRYRDLLDTLGLEKQGLVDATTELAYTFGKSHGGVAKVEILHAILHTGNESNKRKLLLGRGWASVLPDGSLDTSRWDAFVRRMITQGVLTKKDFDFAQGVWDMLEDMKAGAQKTHREVFGRYFDEVTANEFTVQFPEGPVTYRGGYVPAMTDPEIVKDAATRKIMEEQNQTLANAFPSTPKGFTQTRVEYNQPLLLDLRALSGHIDKVLLFTHMEQAVRDVRRVLSSNEVSTPLHRMQPTAYDTMLTPWLNTAARQKVETPTPGDNGLMRGLSKLRNNVGMAAMFANISNAAQQVTGYFTAAAAGVQWGHMLRAQVDYTKAPRQMSQAVATASVYMASRMENEVAAMNEAIESILIDPNVYQSAQAFTAKHAYFLQSAVDNIMGPVIWTAAFNQAMQEMGGDARYADPAVLHREAVRYADARIRLSQGSTLPEDVSRIETGNAFVRLFMQFAGYFNMQANLLGGGFATILRESGLRQGMGRGAYLFLMGFYAPAVIAQLIATAFRGGPDDQDKDGEYLDDWLTDIFMLGPLKNAFAMIPGVGQVGNMAINMIFTASPTDDKMSVSPAVSMIETVLHAPGDVYKAVVDEGNRRRAVRDVATLLSMTTGLPATAVARPLGYLLDVQQEAVTPTSGADMARGLLTGTASPESKNR